MDAFKVVGNENQIKLSSPWRDSLEFNLKNKIVEREGHTYRLVGKERDFTNFELKFEKIYRRCAQDYIFKLSERDQVCDEASL